MDAFSTEGPLVGGAALVAAVRGQVDAVEVDARPRPQPLLPWVYKLWNAGFPIPLVGGSGKDNNRVRLGAMRTYARVPNDDLNPYSAWIEAVRAGRTFVTTGPLLSFNASEDGVSLTVTATARGLQPFEKLEVVADGRVVAEAQAGVGADGIASASLAESLPRAEIGWLAARCWSAAGGEFAHTSPHVLPAEGRTVRRHEADSRRCGRRSPAAASGWRNTAGSRATGGSGSTSTTTIGRWSGSLRRTPDDDREPEPSREIQEVMKNRK